MNSFVKTFLGLCFVLCLVNAAAAATFTVTKIADTNDGTCNADCSLREAVAAAIAAASDDTIEFASPLFTTAQTITLSGTDIIITGNGTLAINGPGANLLTVSGNNQSRVFTNQIVGTVQAVTTISNLRVTGGNGVSTVNTGRAGGVYNNGSVLTLTNVVISGNTAANGGGTNNATGNANMTLINCTVAGNSSTSSGGGMQNFSTSTLTILNSTISGNTSNLSGLAGGAIQANGTVNIANSTISGNSAPVGSAGGIIFNGTGLTLNNVTIANNTAATGAGGLHKSIATLNASVRNTIIANNTGAADSPDALGAFTSRGNNLIGAVGTSTGWIAADLLNQPAALGPLANNGGATQTHALLSSSPAVNAGQNCVTTATCVESNPPVALTTDQRGAGFPRQVGTNVDIGAFEFNPAAVTTRPPFDFDGDGRSDYAVFRPASGTWFLNRSTAGNFAAQFGLSTDRLAPADYDGDGRTDIAVWREASFAHFYILQSSTNTVRGEQFGSIGDNPAVVGDWDGDGKADPAVYRQFVSIPGGSPETIFYYRPSSAPGVNFRLVRWGATGDRPVTGDYDGDGRIDAAVFRPSNGIWYVLQSSNNQPRYTQWGTGTDRLVPADYDGDGRTDVAIWRDGLWAILQSSNSQPRYQPFGQAGDRPITGDYDGDGKNDIAVWRGGVFYVLRSNGNQAQGLQFGTSDDVPVAAAFIP